MHVVATAGHVDHGKSTLVEALTGRDPSRLEEEKKRGLTIELGYCWTYLPEVGDVAFVDVPGHQKFVTTALAGVGPVPVVMFVVAADDPWMPQAAEHLAALDALRVAHGVLVVTRADLADPAPAVARAQAELSTTSLRAAPTVVVSGRTGVGLDLLRSTLADVLRSVPAPDPGADVRLWVDRHFHVSGTGTVVTGTLQAGTVAVGDVLSSSTHQVRVRGIESLEVARDQMSGTARVALDLGGRAAASITRGTPLVTPGAFWTTGLVDVEVSEARALPDQPQLHVGSASLAVRARPLGEDHARLSLGRPLPLRIGDRALLRDPGSRRVWGLRVVDPKPPDLSRRGAAAERGRVLGADDGSLAAQLARRALVRRSELVRIGAPTGPVPPGAVSAGDWLVDAGAADRLRARLRALVENTPAGGPPLTTPAAARRLDLPDPALVPPLVAPPLREVRGTIVGESSPDLSEELRSAYEEIRSDLERDRFAAPDRSRLRDLGLDATALAILERAGHLVRLDRDLVLLPDAVPAAVETLRTLEQPFTASEARQALGTSRRVVLPLLAHLDRSGRTLRLPDDRRRLRG